MAAQWADQGKANLKRALTAAEEMNSVCGKTRSTVAKSTADCSLRPRARV